MKDYVFTDHARFEMKRRGIKESDVNRVLQKPEQSYEVRPGRYIFQSKKYFGKIRKQYLLRVFVDIDRIPHEIVTVYRTSKIEKYWR